MASAEMAEFKEEVAWEAVSEAAAFNEVALTVVGVAVILRQS